MYPSMSQTTFMAASGSGQHPNRPFDIAQVVSNLSSTANSFVSSSVANGPGATSNNNNTFKVPAHKHAHHLHSIPPREKSTRTLIIDHILWVHARTRFSQARAELGMTDRTGGPSSSNYMHRRRPENYEEDDEVGSDGEDVIKLKARSGQPDNPHDDEEDNYLHHQDLPLSQTLRARAEGIERVIVSMLEQPPPIQPANHEDIWSPPTSPLMESHKGDNPQTLPDGVRLRLALSTLINDLFARQAPPPPFRHVQRSPSLPNDSVRSPDTHSMSTGLPPALSSLATISAYISPSANGYHDPNMRKIPARPSARPQTLYSHGADPSTANSPPDFRCPRHLHTSCEICVNLKTGPRPGMIAGIRGRSTSGGMDHTRRPVPPPTWKGMSGVIGIAADGGGITGWQDGSGVGTGLMSPGIDGSVLRRKNPFSEDSMRSGSGNTKLTQLIPRFIRLSALVACELGREFQEDAESSLSSSEEDEDEEGVPSAPNQESMPSTNSIPARVERSHFSLPPSSSPFTLRAISQAQEAASKKYSHVLRPSRVWYMLLAGLLTRAALEGYLTAGWRGFDSVECLLTCGLGMSEFVPPDSYSTDDEQFSDFDPDELPSVRDAIKMLFPSLRGTFQSKDHLEQEFEVEMDERRRKFYDIPPSTPDLSTHMEDLAWQYPAEPVERAAVRFGEAIARWRGKPELETYKKRPPKPSSGLTSTAPVTIDSLVHSNPTSPSMPNISPSSRPKPASTRKPSIEVFFLRPVPMGETGSSWNPNFNSNKRQRPTNDTRPTNAKRQHT